MYWIHSYFVFCLIPDLWLASNQHKQSHHPAGKQDIHIILTTHFMPTRTTSISCINVIVILLHKTNSWSNLQCIYSKAFCQVEYAVHSHTTFVTSTGWSKTGCLLSWNFLLIIKQNFACSALSPLVGHQEEHLACKNFPWWSAGMVICLKRGTNELHMVQLMSLPPHHHLLLN